MFHQILGSSPVAVIAKTVWTTGKDLFNISLLQVAFPDKLRITWLFFKDGDKPFHWKWKPVSVLQYFSKLVERNVE